MKARLHNLHDNQAGMASIILTLVFLIVISLTVLGFAQLSRRETRASLDRQLSTQAFYAAESGINDTLAIIKDAIAHGRTITPKTDCNSGSFVQGANLQPTLNSRDNVNYTCILVDPAPQTLVFNPITTQHSKVILVQSSPPDNSSQPQTVSKVNFSWQSAVLPPAPTFTCGSGTTNAASGLTIPPAANWAQNCGASILRVDVVPGDPIDLSGGDTDLTFFLYPQSGGSAANPTVLDASNPGSIQGKLEPVACTASPSQSSVQFPNDCSFSLTGLAGLSSNGEETSYYLRVQPIYTDQNVTVSAEHVVSGGGGGNNGNGGGNGNAGSTGGILNLMNDQIVIDSTGQAQDVLRRLQVRASVNDLNTSFFPDEALHSTNSLCKEFYIIGSGNLPLNGPDACSYP